MKGQTVVLALGAAVLLTLTALVAGPRLALRPSAQGLPVPPLLQDLPAGFPEAAAAFDARIAEAFPPGSSEAALIQRLRSEGFRWPPSDDVGSNGSKDHQASFVLPRSACVLTGRVRWRSEAHRLVLASGSYDGTCL